MNAPVLLRRGPGAPARFERIRIIALALLALMGPTAGDIGSCGQDVAELDGAKFFAEKQFIDCTKCRECGFATQACERACGQELLQSSFDELCLPFVHDGEVCLNALRAADCDEYGAFVADVAPVVPTECNFCPAALEPVTSSTTTGTGGAGGSSGEGGG